MPKQKLTTARQILAALGGVEKIAVLTQKSAKVVYHWQAINQFPSHTYCIMRRELKRHGYKGAFEIAATVDYMFAFAATTGAVKTHHFDLAYDAFLADEDTREFITTNNPAALKEIAERFEEAATRGLWTPRLNSAYDLLRELQQ